MAISFSGLSTGLDTAALVEQLVGVELLPAKQLETRKSNAGRRSAIVSDLVSKLKGLQSAATALDTSSEVRSMSSRSSDEARVKVTSSGAAQPGQLALRVSTLARSQTNVSSTFAGLDSMVPGAGQLGIKIGDGQEVIVDYTSLDSLADVTRRINEEVDGVHAELIDTGAGVQIAISSDESGTANALSFTEAGNSLGFLAPGSTKVTAQDASFTMNGIAMTRSSNTVSDAVPGITLDLVGPHAVGEPDTMVTVETDPEGVETKIKSLVEAFNGLADLVNAQTSFNGVSRGQDTLFGDSTVRALQRGMAEMVSRRYPHGEGTVTLGQLGIELGRDGRLSIDSTALADAVADDPQALENLIAGTDGFASAVNKLVDQYTRAGDGFLTAKKTSLTEQMSDFDDQIERIEARASRVGDQLHAQFSALESLMSSFQSQQATLAALFG